MHIPNESLSKFCERGGQIMYIPLDELAKKDGMLIFHLQRHISAKRNRFSF